MKMFRTVASLALALTLIAAPASASDDAAPVLNDTVADATLINELPFWAYGDTYDAVDNSDDEAYPSCFSHSDYSVWFEYTAPAGAEVVFSTMYSEFDTVIDVFQNAENIACNDDASWDYTSKVTVPVADGETYLIRVAGLGGQSGPFTFSAKEFLPMQATVTVADRGSLRMNNGRAIVQATVECNQDGYVELGFVGSQLTGSGGRSHWVDCGAAFPVRINSRKGDFLPGPMDVEWSGYACSWDSYGWYGVAEPAEGMTAMDHDEEPVIDSSCTELAGSKTVFLMPSQ